MHTLLFDALFHAVVLEKKKDLARASEAERECGNNEWKNEAITNKLSDFKVEQTTF